MVFSSGGKTRIIFSCPDREGGSRNDNIAQAAASHIQRVLRSLAAIRNGPRERADNNGSSYHSVSPSAQVHSDHSWLASRTVNIGGSSECNACTAVAK